MGNRGPFLIREKIVPSPPLRTTFNDADFLLFFFRREDDFWSPFFSKWISGLFLDDLFLTRTGNTFPLPFSMRDFGIAGTTFSCPPGAWNDHLHCGFFLARCAFASPFVKRKGAFVPIRSGSPFSPPFLDQDDGRFFSRFR